MTNVDFSDQRSAQQWVEKQSPEFRNAIASRAALRVVANTVLHKSKVRPKLILAALRAAMISSVCGSGKAEDIGAIRTAAAQSAHFAAIGTADPASNYAICSAAAAVRSAAFPERRSNDTLSAVDNSICCAAASASATVWDASQTETLLFHFPVWPTGVPSEMLKTHAAFLEWLSIEDCWDFWTAWYQSMWNGTFTDWGLASEVAKIPNDVWMEGAHSVATEIIEIKDQLLIKRLPQAEIIFENEDGLYDVRAMVADSSQLMASVLQRIDFAFSTALRSNICDLNEMSMPAKILRHALEVCPDDPNALEQFFRQAGAMIKRKVKEGRFAECDELEFLIGTLDEVALQLRADHPEVAIAAEGRTRQTLKEISSEKRLELASKIEVMAEGSAPRLAQEFKLAADTTRGDEAVEAQASAIKMSGERAAKISLAERAKKVEGSGGMAATKIALRARDLVDFVVNFISGSGAS